MRPSWTACAIALTLACTQAGKTNQTVVTCPTGAAYCSGSCSSLATDASNCGACGHVCAIGEVCSGGTCTTPTLPCAGALQACGGVCTDVSSSRADCGACGHVCALHEDCVSGLCTLRCQADLALCGTACANLSADEQNCGACGRACASGVSCVDGICGGGTGTGGCAAGLSPCGGTCVNTATDAANCGACGHACGAGQFCSSATCHCGSNLSFCDAACVNTATDPANCGSCGTTCASGLCVSSVCQPVCTKTLCGTSCVDLQGDRANCGACGHACVNGETCSAGACVCAAGSAVCDGSSACVDLAWDADHCGTCSTACGSGEACVSGVCAADASAFRMLGGDVGHSGFNPGETGTPPLTLAWTAPATGGKGPAVIEGGRVLTVGGSRLYAHEATSGAELWSYSFGSVFAIGWPAVCDGRVYVATSNNYADTWMRSFDRATGAVQFKVGFGSQWEQYWSPIVVGTTVYANGGSYGGLYGFDTSRNGVQAFFTSLDQYSEWSPAFFGTTVYTFVNGNVRAHDRWSGAVLSTLNVGWTWNGYSMRTAPAFGDRYGYVISPPNLVAFEPLGAGTAALRQAWAVNSAYTAYPAVAGGTVYAISNGNLHALDALTGARKWLFTGDDHLAYPPVIAGGYVYVASTSNVYAVNAATHLQAWTAPVGGRLAIGAGVLVVSRESDGAVFAYRLTR